MTTLAQLIARHKPNRRTAELMIEAWEAGRQSVARPTRTPRPTTMALIKHGRRIERHASINEQGLAEPQLLPGEHLVRRLGALPLIRSLKPRA